MSKLSKLEKATLAFTQTYKDKNPTLIGMFRFNAKRYVLSLMVFSIIIFIEYLFAGWLVASLFFAFVLGAFCRDIGIFRNRIRLWPMNREVIDWDKVAAKLDKLEQESSKKGDVKP